MIFFSSYICHMENYIENKKQWDLKSVIWNTHSSKAKLISVVLTALIASYWIYNNIQQNKNENQLKKLNSSFKERVEQSNEIQSLICEINSIAGANLTKLTIPDDFIIGIHLDSNKLTKRNIYITNECLVKSPISLKEIYPVSELRYYEDLLIGIESNNGTFIVDPNNPILTKGQIKSLMIRTGIKSFLEEGVYKLPKNYHETKYLIGVISVAFFYEDHIFTEKEKRVITLKANEIATNLNRIYNEKN